jgi:acetyl esterase/lipase
MDAELAAILARPLSSEPSDPASAGSPATLFAEHDSVQAPGRDELVISDQFIPGPEGAPDVGVRIYDAPGRTDPAPCLVYFHGGGFIAGDLDTEDVRCVRLANDVVCVVVSVDYRLAPQHPFPAAIDDCYAALLWTASMVENLGIDATRLGVGGPSAGGALAAAIALMARDRGGPALAFQLLVYPCLDDRAQTVSMRFVGTPIVDGGSIAWLWNAYLGEDRSNVSPYAAPARADELGGLPPAYVMTAELDPLRDEGIEYAMRLLHAGVSVELHQFAGAFHGFDLLPTALSRRAADEQVDWLRAITQRLDHRGETR